MFVQFHRERKLRLAGRWADQEGFVSSAGVGTRLNFLSGLLSAAGFRKPAAQSLSTVRFKQFVSVRSKG